MNPLYLYGEVYIDLLPGVEDLLVTHMESAPRSWRMALRFPAPRLASSIVLVLLMVMLAPLVSQAQVKPAPEDDISVLQRKPFLRKGRAELSPKFGLTINDDLIQQFELGGQLNYHATEFLWFGARFGWFDLGELGGVTDQYFEVLDKTSSVPDVVELQWYAGGDVGIVPIYGKFAIFNNAVVYYDVSLYAGGGWVNHFTSQGEAGAFAGEVGIMPRIFLNRWLGLHIAVQDRIMSAQLRESTSLVHIVTAELGLSIFMPFGFEYTTAR